MIDKFNFYDIYGYFIPGAALVLLLWLPFGLIRGISPPSDLGSAVIGAVISYVIGHLLHMICTRVFPATIAANGRQRNLSDMVVDEDDKNLAKEFKTKLAELIKKKFDLDLQINATPTEEIDRVRGDAFYLARHALIRAKEMSYAEQFQGMYTLARGLSAAFAIAAVYYAGWGLSVLHEGWVDCVFIIVITISLLAADNFTAWASKGGGKRLENLSSGALLLAALAGGYLLGRRFEPTPIKAEILGLCAIGAVFAVLRCYRAYKSFSLNFAKAIWRDFYSSIDKEPPPANDAV